jgi:flagellar biosynthesis regulator FlaF
MQFGKGHAAVWTQKEWTGVADDLVKPTNSLERKKFLWLLKFFKGNGI